MPAAGRRHRSPKTLWRRFILFTFQCLYYLGCYTVFIGTQYIAGQLAWLVLGSEIQEFPIVARAAQGARIGLALLTIGLIFVQGLFGAWAQFQIDQRLSKERDELL